MNTEERQLTDLLHRVTPEPPRRVTVEDIAFRLANEAGQDRQARYRAPRLREPAQAEPRRTRPSPTVGPRLGARPGRGGRGRGGWRQRGPGRGADLELAPGQPAAPGSTLTSSSAAPATSAPSAVLSSPGTISPVPITGAPYGAELVNRAKIMPGTLVSGDNFLFGVEPGYLDQIDPANGNVLDRAPDSAQVISAPVIVGDQVWAVTTYNSAVAILTGYNATTLKPVASVTVPVSGRVSFAAAGVLAGSGHDLYLAAGNDIAGSARTPIRSPGGGKSPRGRSTRSPPRPTGPGSTSAWAASPW